MQSEYSLHSFVLYSGRCWQWPSELCSILAWWIFPLFCLHGILQQHEITMISWLLFSLEPIQAVSGWRQCIPLDELPAYHKALYEDLGVYYLIHPGLEPRTLHFSSRFLSDWGTATLGLCLWIYKNQKSSTLFRLLSLPSWLAEKS